MTEVVSDPAAAQQLPVIAIVGATATGKTALSVALAQRLDGEIINADAMQFYRGMDIGTAKASPAERQGIPHHLIDVMELSEEASVADFQRLARETIDALHARGKTPILVGGSGLYVRAVLDRIDFPPTDPQVRQRYEEIVRAGGLAAAKQLLSEVDPVSAERLNDERRIVRALEVHELTGRAFSSYMPQREYFYPNSIQLGLRIDRTTLHERIRARVESMVEAGLAGETQCLVEQGLASAPTASRAIGYPQTVDYLQGKLSRQEWVEKIATATRQFARRQDTWFKADPRVHWLDWDAADLPQQAERIVAGH